MTEREANEAKPASFSPWHTASYSAERGECVEISEGPATGIRDTQNRKHGALFFTANEWQAFLDSTRINS